MTVSIERISDTVGVLTGVGALPTVGPADSAHIIAFGDALHNVFDTSPTGSFPNNPVVSTMSVGLPIGYSRTYVPTSTLYFGNSNGSALSGSILGELQITLGSGTWASVGTTGDLFWGAAWGAGAVEIGTWEITSTVPVPAALPLLLSVLAGLGFAGWRKQAAAA